MVCVLLASRLRGLAALAGIGLCAGALVSIVIARYAGSGFVDYREPTFRGPVVLAIVLKLGAMAAPGAWLPCASAA